MAAWKLVAVALKAKRTWSRVPPAQRRKMVENVGKQVRAHGPTVAKAVREQGPVVAKRLGDAIRKARK